MYKFIYHIHYRLGFQISRENGQSTCSEKEKSGMDGHFVNKEQLMDLDNDNIKEEKDEEDLELEGIDVAI